jgi:hypothetical protein
MEGQDLFQLLLEHAPLWLAILAGLLSGFALNYLGVKYFDTVANSATFASGVVLATLFATSLIVQSKNQTYMTNDEFLPLLLWVVVLVLTWIDNKLHLSQFLQFIGFSILCGIGFILLIAELKGKGTFSDEETWGVVGITFVVAILGGIIAVKVAKSRIMLILTSVLLGSLLIGNVISFSTISPGSKPGTMNTHILDLQMMCLTQVNLCDRLLSSEGKTINDLLPFITPLFCLIPISGLLVQISILIGQRRKEKLHLMRHTDTPI